MKNSQKMFIILASLFAIIAIKHIYYEIFFEKEVNLRYIKFLILEMFAFNYYCMYIFQTHYIFFVILCSHDLIFQW